MKHNFKPFSYNRIFIETGSYVGQGIKKALNSDFDRVISIELSSKYFQKCKEKFKGNSRVELHYGDSSVILPKILSKISEPVTFWLDGHFSGKDTAGADNPIPLFDELRAISSHHVKTHTILIDDMRLVRSKSNEFKDIKFTEEDIKRLLANMNSDYQFSYENGKVENDILIAEVIRYDGE